MFVGIFLVLLGILFILDNLDFISGELWSYIWPLIIICIGLSIIFNRVKVKAIDNETESD